jgi:hypothetical protein
MNTHPCHIKQSKISSGRLLTLLGRAGECRHEVKKTKKGAKAPKDLIETTGNYSLINAV